MIKIGVFYDGNFLLHSSNYYNYVHPEKSRLSINGFHKFISDRVAKELGRDVRDCMITQTHYFRGRLNASDAASRDSQLYNDRVFDDILMAEGIHTHYLPLRNVQGRKEEKGINVWLSLEVFHAALKSEIDIAVLIVADTDYAPMIRKVQAEGVPAMVIGWEFEYTLDNGQHMVTRMSQELISLAAHTVAMHEEIERGLLSGDPMVKGLFVNLGESQAAASENERETDMEVETGEIMSLKKGFGFIKYPNNNLFFHGLDVEGNFADLQEGDMVEFTTEKNQQGQYVAKSVRKIG